MLLKRQAKRFPISELKNWRAKSENAIGASGMKARGLYGASQVEIAQRQG
jgi:hypothetical protein